MKKRILDVACGSKMKKIMRENGIMVIPSEYPGSTEKWNIQKPRDKKEEL